MRTTLASDDRWEIGIDDDGNPVQEDDFGEEVPASEGTYFRDRDGQEWRVENGHWSAV